MTVIKLIAEGTIEERVVALQEEKKELIEQVMSGQAENTLTSLSEAELMKLLVEEL